MWKPAAVFGLFFLWLVLMPKIGDLLATIVFAVALVTVFWGGRLRDRYRNRSDGVE